MKGIDKSNPNVAMGHIIGPIGNPRINVSSLNQVYVYGDNVNILE
jgi:hypothetical protein